MCQNVKSLKMWNLGITELSVFKTLRTQTHPFPKFTQIHRKNRTIYTGIRFDKIPNYKKSDPADEEELNDVSRLSIKTLPFPSSVKERLFSLIKTSLKKKDIDKIGSYVSKKMASRASVEMPRILPSALLDQNSENNKFFDQINELSNDPKFEQFFHLLNRGSAGPNEQAQIDLTEAEDSRHKNTKLNFTPEISLAYTAHTYFAHYAVFTRIFHEIKKRVENLKLSKVLFYNPGHGSSIVCANSIFDLKQSEVLVVEPLENLWKICEHLTSGLIDIQYQGGIYELTQHFDMIVLPFVLINTMGYQSRNLLVKNLWNRLKIGGILVVAEPGTPTGFRIIHSLRELFISQIPEKSFHFIAPCPHEGICPLALTGKDWCHFSQRIFKIPHYVYKKGQISRGIDDVKFSYLVVGKFTGPRQKFSKESQSLTPIQRSYFWPRIVMNPIKAGKRVLLDVCTNSNNFKRLIVPKNTPESSGYRYARDSLWGDLWRFSQREEKPIARGYTPKRVMKYLLNKSKKREQLEKTA